MEEWEKLVLKIGLVLATIVIGIWLLKVIVTLVWHYIWKSKKQENADDKRYLSVFSRKIAANHQRKHFSN